MRKYKQLTEQEIVDVQKKFNMLKEYSFITKKGDMLLDEDDEDPNLDVQPPVDDATAQLPAEQPQAEPQVNPMDIQQPATPETAPVQSPPMPEAPIQPAPEEGGEIEIDMTDLVDDQEKVTNTVNALASQTGEMLGILSTLTNKVDNILSSTETEMQNIKAEIEKRNPTPKEILQKHQTLGAPFTQTPEDYWKQKEAEGTYELSDSSPEKEYELKTSDLSNNQRDIYKTFGLDDNEVNQSMKSVMGY